MLWHRDLRYSNTKTAAIQCELHHVHDNNWSKNGNFNANQSWGLSKIFPLATTKLIAPQATPSSSKTARIILDNTQKERPLGLASGPFCSAIKVSRRCSSVRTSESVQQPWRIP